MNLNERFTLEQFLHSDTAIAKGIDNSCSEEYKLKAVKLANELSNVENVLLIKMNLNSVFRCLKLNTTVGGATTSQHMKMEAADTTCNQYDTKTYYDKVKEAVEEGKLKIDQCIYEISPRQDGTMSKWVHLSFAFDRENRNDFLFGQKILVNGKWKSTYSKDPLHEEHSK